MFQIRYILLLLLTLSFVGVHSQAMSPEELARINKLLPHKFKEIRTGTTIEVVRNPQVVKLYVLVDDIEQYDQILIERSDELGTNFSQCKQVTIKKGKYPNNYIELTDHYPVSSKMSNLYRIKTISSEGIIRMYSAVPISIPEVVGVAQK
jgi:hypothetical protein